jgi:hypothetical protein
MFQESEFTKKRRKEEIVADEDNKVFSIAHAFYR